MPVVRSGRCDECRRRKRKCDEARPCSGCLDRSVHCVYSFEVSKFIHLHQAQPTDSSSSSEPELQVTRPKNKPQKEIVLNIRSAREPPSGNGIYHTFVPLRTKAKEKPRPTKPDAERRSISLSPPPCSDLLRLQSEFHEVLYSASSKGLQLRTLGRWLEMCIPRIGSCPVLDRSIACLIAGHKARYGCDERAMRSGRHRYGESLVLLKDTVAAGVKSITAETIAATRILMMYEIMVGNEYHGWISHAYGTINLFVALGPESVKGNFERHLFYGTYAQAWQQALMVGKPSVFDKQEWLNIPPTYESSSRHTKRRLYVLTKLPRLTALVRAVRKDPRDVDLAARATKLAEELLALDWGDDEAWEPQPALSPTRRAEDAKLVPISFNWDEEDLTAVSALNLWWTNKIMLSGLCQMLHSCGAPLEWPTLTDLYQEEQQCAMNVCMSMDFFESIAPYACMIFLQFMQVAWGVFWRQKDFPTSIDGHAMAGWLLRRGNGFMARFINSKAMTSSGLAFNTERLMGGPILPPEWYEVHSEGSSQDALSARAAMVKDARPCHGVSVGVSVDDETSTDGGSEFNEGIRNAFIENQNFEGAALMMRSSCSVELSEREPSFAQSFRNTMLDSEYLT